MGVAVLGDGRVDFVGMCGVEFVGPERAGCGDEDASRAARVAVARFGVVLAVCDGG